MRRGRVEEASALALRIGIREGHRATQQEPPEQAAGQSGRQGCVGGRAAADRA